MKIIFDIIKRFKSIIQKKTVFKSVNFIQINQIKKIKEVKKELIQKNNELVGNKNLLTLERNEKRDVL